MNTKIKLRSLTLHNFKGVRDLIIYFEGLKGIYGKNKTGKTSIVDAFMWLLFGKDSTDRKDFEIKTLDSNNNVIPNIDHEVSADIQVGEQVITLRRTLRENWVKKRGTTIAEFQGNETLYFWNDVPLKQSEYQAKVSSIVDESLFKLITNPLYFSTTMKWQDRRQVLFSMAPSVSNEYILDSIATFDNKTQIGDITNMLNQGKSLVEYKKEISAKKKKLKDELLLIPSRIDEASRSMPEVQDWLEIEAQVTNLNNSIQRLNKSKEDQSSALNEQNLIALNRQRELNGLKQDLQTLIHGLSRTKNSDLQKLNDERENVKHSLSSILFDIERGESRKVSIDTEIETITATNNKLREQWAIVNERTLVIPNDATCCPACKRELESDQISDITTTLTANFNEAKARELKTISEKGKFNSTRIEDLKLELQSIENNFIEKSGKRDHLRDKESELTLHIQDLNNTTPVETEDITMLRAKIQGFEIPQATTPDFQAVNNEILGLQNNVRVLESRLNNRNQIKKINERITELKTQESTMSQELATLENTEFVIDAFNKRKIDMMVESVNSRFKYVKFKLFKEQINGGLDECCEALIDGVPYSDANTASKVNAGLDIINALCEYHGVSAPIFIDNRESVNELIPVQSQVINLFVTETDDTLRFERNQTQTA